MASAGLQPPSPPHFVLFPFMSKGHTIPILHLARLLSRRGITITIFTTPSNSLFISQSLNNYQVTILELPFPENIPELPPGIESTDKLPSMSLFLPFTTSTKLMKPHFDQALQTLLPPVTCIISDGFLWWTVDSATKLCVPRLVYYGMSNYAVVLSRVVSHDRLLASIDSDDQLFTVPTFPWIKLTRNDFEYPFNEPNPKGPFIDFIIEQAIATSNSKGVIVNSFSELEPVFLDYWNKEWKPKAWCVGPLCLSEPPSPSPEPQKKPKWVEWLDEKEENGQSVLYVAFGTQAELTGEQLREIAVALERTQVSFLWVLRRKGAEEVVVAEEMRGLVVSEWVDQGEILRHKSVNGFMSHCGWNSVMESMCAGVPLLAWPMMAEQHLNARMVVEEIGMGVRVMTENGSVRGFVKSEMIERMVKELMEGKIGKKVRKKAKELGELGRKAMEEGGSSWLTLEALIGEICGSK